MFCLTSTMKTMKRQGPKLYFPGTHFALLNKQKTLSLSFDFLQMETKSFLNLIIKKRGVGGVIHCMKESLCFLKNDVLFICSWFYKAFAQSERCFV